jgi:hypothetical protein
MAAYSEPLRELMQQKVEWGPWLAKKLGSSAGGIGYEIEAADGSIARYAIVAADSSYLAAVAPAVMAVRAIAREEFAGHGLVPSSRHVKSGELFTYLEQNGIELTDVR